jgi:hypothetical protein
MNGRMPLNPYAPPAGGGADPTRVPAAPVEPPPGVSALASVRFAFTQVGLGNLAMGLLLLIIPIVGPILLAGWHAETHRRLVRRETPCVRRFAFGEFTSYLMAGLVPFVAQMAVTFMAMLPAVFVLGLGAAVAIPLFARGGPEPAVVILLALGVAGAALVVGVLVGVLVTAMQIRAELSGSFPRTFDPPAIGRFVQRRWLQILGHSLLLALLAMPLMVAGLLVFIVGIYLVVVAVQFAQVHLRWQIYEADVREGGEILPVFPGNGADL